MENQGSASAERFDLRSVLDFGYLVSVPIEQSIDQIRALGADVKFAPEILTVGRAKRAIILFQDGAISGSALRQWARFVLGRRDVILEENLEDLLLEFLESFAFQALDDTIESLDTVTWQSRLDLLV